MNWLQTAFESWWEAHKLEVVGPLVLIPSVALVWVACVLVEQFNKRK
jgi:hypothetical protein